MIFSYSAKGPLIVFVLVDIIREATANLFGIWTSSRELEPGTKELALYFLTWRISMCSG